MRITITGVEVVYWFVLTGSPLPIDGLSWSKDCSRSISARSLGLNTSMIYDVPDMMDDRICLSDQGTQSVPRVAAGEKEEIKSSRLKGTIPE
ncbi:hypothetical protein CEXT_683631 [Caerostris extrusa]|uniref:Uncharacterized protein n=1 Tax=Caerostris extrusa TaxID=172846 RepID=A0AAV4PRQ7_CAEEX|nr:hypothetical protein CEXT_683631 [Caerostris extrusa]